MNYESSSGFISNDKDETRDLVLSLTRLQLAHLRSSDLLSKAVRRWRRARADLPYLIIGPAWVGASETGTSLKTEAIIAFAVA